MLLYARTALTPENFSQISLPSPARYFSYSPSLPGRTSNRYSKVIIPWPPFPSDLSARPGGCPLSEKRRDPLLGVGRHGVHRHDFLGICVRLRLIEVDLRVERL